MLSIFKSKKFFIAVSCYCLFLCSLGAIFGLFCLKNEVHPELFDSLVTGFLWTFCISGILAIGLCFTVRRDEMCLAHQRVVTTESLDAKDQSEPVQILAVGIPNSQNYKHEPLEEEEEVGLTSVSVTPAKSRVSI